MTKRGYDKRRNVAECDSGPRNVVLGSICAVRHSLGRALQVLGLVLLPVGLLYGLERGPNAMALEIGFGLAGVGMFLVGLQLQKRSGG